MTVVFGNADLLPREWRTADIANVRAFNPGVLRIAGGWLLAYRIVAEPKLERRIAFCRLDDDLRVVPESHVPFSDLVRFRPFEGPMQATSWFADPRLYRLQERLFVYWNSGWHEPRNYQFLQEIDSQSFHPIGSPREMTLRGERQKLEKNWTLFERGDLYAVYSINPHRVLTFSLLGEGPMEFCDIGDPIPNPAGYAKIHGGLRGGAPPQFFGNHYFSFCHSIENRLAGYSYVPAVYRFSAESPFKPTDMPSRPLEFAISDAARRSMPKLNPAVADVIYPSGAAYDVESWLVSFGIDDERCGVARVALDDVDRTLAPVV